MLPATPMASMIRRVAPRREVTHKPPPPELPPPETPPEPPEPCPDWGEMEVTMGVWLWFIVGDRFEFLNKASTSLQ